jgi:lipid-A-disaccharide synthase
MIIAGEASGDHHGARLVEAMRQKHDNLFFCGIGGKSLAAAGVRILVDASTLSVVGFTEVFAKLPQLLHSMGRVKKLLKGLQPDLLILIDFPDFNLRMAAAAKELSIPVLYYISPQIWAWRTGRVKKIRRLVDHMAVILPFEAQFYHQYQVPVTFVGHPLLDRELPITDDSASHADLSTIALLPGSRDGEVSRHLPVMLAAAERLTRKNGKLKFLVSQAPTVQGNLLASIVSAFSGKIACEIDNNEIGKILGRCGFAIVVSGTASLETAVHATPMVIIYRLSPLSYRIGRIMIKVDYAGLINLIAEKEVIPELLQQDASAETIAERVYELISDPARLARMKKDMARAVIKLGGPGAAARTADVALKMLKG